MADQGPPAQNYHVHSTPRVIREDQYVRSTNAPEDENILSPELRQVLIKTHRINETIIAENLPSSSSKKVIPVVEINTGKSYYMVPLSPERIYYKDPVEKIVEKQHIYKCVFLIATISLLTLAIIELFFWVTLTDDWPIDFITALIVSRISILGGGNLKKSAFVLAVHPIIHANLALIVVFWCKERGLKVFCLRSVYFCYVTAIFIAFLIYVTSTISPQDIVDIFEEGIDMYDLYNWTHIDKDQLKEARYYYKNWNAMQAYLRCCGIRQGFKDWALQRRGELIKVPRTCCVVYSIIIEANRTMKPPNYKEDLDYCQKFPSETNTWNKSCLDTFYAFFLRVVAGIFLTQLVDIIFVLLISYNGIKYHTCRKQELNDEYIYGTSQCLLDCCCLSLCIKPKKKKIDEEVQEIKQRESVQSHWRNSVQASVHEDDVEFEVRHKHRAKKDHSGESIAIIPAEVVIEHKISRLERQSSARKSILAPPKPPPPAAKAGTNVPAITATTITTEPKVATNTGTNDEKGVDEKISSTGTGVVVSDGGKDTEGLSKQA